MKIKYNVKNSCRSIFRQMSTSFRTRISRPLKRIWRNNPTSIKISVVVRQGCRLNLFATRILTSEEQNQTSGSLSVPPKTTVEYLFIETLKLLKRRQT